MLNLKDNLTYEYNSAYDILYLTFNESIETYSHEDISGIVLNYDYFTREFVGADIWDFKRRMQENSPIILPIDVDLKAIYNHLKS